MSERFFPKGFLHEYRREVKTRNRLLSALLEEDELCISQIDPELVLEIPKKYGWHISKFAENEKTLSEVASQLLGKKTNIVLKVT